MRVLSILFILVLSVSCSKQSAIIKTTETNYELSDFPVNIRILNETAFNFDTVEVHDLIFENIEGNSQTAYQGSNNTEVRHIDDFYTVATIGEESYSLGFWFCGTPPIPKFQKNGNYTIVIKSVNEDERKLETETVED